MRKVFLLSVLMAFFIFMGNAYAENTDALSLFQGDYVGVGAIDMQKVPQRKIYKDLRKFFETDAVAKKALSELESAGLNDKSLKRILVGIPADVEKSEFLVLFEALESVTKYVQVLETHNDQLTQGAYQNHNYYCMKSANYCIVILDQTVAFGSELKLKGLLDTYAGAAVAKRSVAFEKTLKDTDRNKDAWLAFQLDERQRTWIGRTDPVVDMTDKGLGKLTLGSLVSGDLTVDFSSGLNALITLRMADTASATSFSKIINNLIEQGLADETVKNLGIVSVVEGIQTSSKNSNVMVTISYSPETFSKLTALVTDLAKSAAQDYASMDSPKKVDK